MVTNYTYNANNWLTGKTNKKTDNTLLSQYTYTHYRDGNIYQENAGFKKEDNSWQTQNRTYNYDPQGRLVQVAETSASNTTTTNYTYDLRGNRVTKASGADTTSYTYDLNNRLLSEAEGDTTTLYEYDDRGNLVSKRKETITDETVTTDSASVLTDNLSENVELYTYNGFNQLSEYRTGGTRASYVYNAEGIRASKTVNGATTQFLLDGANVIGEVNANSQVTHYIRGVSGIIYSVDGSYAQSTKKYYTTNGHGDVVGLLNNAGVLTKSYTYDPFGVEQNIDTNDTNPFRYCGEYFDNESKDLYLRARYYNASTGRFNQQDPAMADGMNWYNYCGGNPVNYIDLTGFSAQSNILSVLRAYQHGYVTKEQMMANIAQNGGSGIVLDIPAMTQQPFGMRCTPTSGAMVDTLYTDMSGDAITQAVNTALGINIDDPFSGGLWPEDMNGVVGFTLTRIDTNLPFNPVIAPGIDSIVGELQKGNPLLFVVEWEGGGLHTMVITGYLNIDGVDMIIYNDPWTGEQYMLPYSEFASENGIDQGYNKGTWTTTYTTQENN